MRFRLLGAAALVAAAVIPQGQASAWTCYGVYVYVCDVLTDHPTVCVYPGGPQNCHTVDLDTCLYDQNHEKIWCFPVVWPPG